MAWDKGTTNNGSVNLAPRAAHEQQPATAGRGVGGAASAIISSIAEGMRGEALATTPQQQLPQATHPRRRASFAGASRLGSNASVASLTSELGSHGSGGGFFARRGSYSSGGTATARRRGSLSGATLALADMDESQRQELERVRSAIKDLGVHSNAAVKELLGRHVNCVECDERRESEGEGDDENLHNSLTSLDSLSIGFDDDEMDDISDAEAQRQEGGNCKVTEFRRAVKRLSMSCAVSQTDAVLQKNQDSARSAGSLMKKFSESLSNMRLEDELVQT